jgi:hypothetical protein
MQIATNRHRNASANPRTVCAQRLTAEIHDQVTAANSTAFRLIPTAKGLTMITNDPDGCLAA